MVKMNISRNMNKYEVINLAPVSEADVLLSLVEERKAELEKQKQNDKLKEENEVESNEL